MRKIYVTESQITEVFGMGLSYFNGPSNIPEVKADSEVTTGGKKDKGTKITTDKIKKYSRTYFGPRKVIRCSLEKKNLTESNQELVNNRYQIPEKLYKTLCANYNRVKNNTNIKGAQRLRNLVNNKAISYNEMYRLKNYFENLSQNDDEYILLGGNEMVRWIDQQLKSDTTTSKNTKKVKKEILGMRNVYQKEGGTKNSGNNKAHSKKNGVTFTYQN
jgi:hypothetical protein